MARRKKSLLTHLKHTFVASRENAFHPHLLKREALLAVLMLVVLIEGAVLAQELIGFQRSGYLASVLPGVVTALTNDARSSDHLALLTSDPVLSAAAQAKADDMAAKGYFSHVSPDGTLPWHWFDQAGYNYEYAGENLAVNFDDSKQLVDAWLASPAHRANILGSHFTTIGVGLASGTYEGKSTIFVVQFFAKPASAASAATSALTSTGQTKAKQATVAITSIPATVPIVIHQGSSPEPEILGVETATTTRLTKMLASPVSTSTYAFGALAILLILALVLGLVFHRRLPRGSALLAGLAVLALLLALALVNKNFLLSALQVPTDGTQAATSTTPSPLTP